MIYVKEVKSKSKKYIVLINTDGEDKSFTVSEELFIEYRLLKGKELEKKTYEKFLKDYASDVVYQKVLHYALYKQRCTNDIIEYLKRNKVEKSDYSYYLNRLYKSRILDDVLYAKNYIEESFEFKKYGKKKIIYDLESKFIKPELYRDFIDNITDQKQIENIEYLFNKKIASLKPQSIRQAIQKIKTTIVNKGYDISLVNTVVNNHQATIEEKIDEDEALTKDIQYALKKYKNQETKKNEKILASLLRKGYSYHKIKSKLGDFKDE